MIYAITTIFYIPVFIYIMLKLKKKNPPKYNEYKCKFTSFFSLFLLFLCIRFYIYIDIQELKFIFTGVSPLSEIPLYISEIILTLAISYILFPDSRVENQRETFKSSRHQSYRLSSSPQTNKHEGSHGHQSEN